MILNKFFVIALATLIASHAYSSAELTQVQKKGALFLLEKQSVPKSTLQKSNFLTLKQWSADTCKPNNSLNQECVTFAQPSWPTQEEKLKVVRACKSDIDMTCVKQIVPSWPTFEQKLEVIEACRDNVNMDCVKFLMPSWPTQEEKIQVTNACRNSDLACIKQILPSWPTLADKIEAAKVCGE